VTGAGRTAGGSAPGPAAAAPAAALLRDVALWSGGLAVAAALHAGVAWWALRPRADPPPAPAPGAILFELAPLPAAPRTPAEDVAPRPPTAEHAAAPPPSEAAPGEPSPQPAERRLEPAPQAAVEAPEASPATGPEIAAQRPRPRPLDLPPPTQAAAGAVAAGGARPAPPQRQAAPAAEARPAPQLAAPQEGRGEPRARVSPQRWQAQLLAHLERRKRYPREARARGEQGVVYLTFSIDRAGNVGAARVVRSSGAPALDRGALDLLRRASPVPAPPPEVQELTFTVPVQFALR
jgi:protein TonB